MRGLTVRQLIAKLKRMPPGALVGWQDHDQSADELNARVGYVGEASPALEASHGVGVVLST
jgi:hypothetical protein